MLEELIRIADQRGDISGAGEAAMIRAAAGRFQGLSGYDDFVGRLRSGVHRQPAPPPAPTPPLPPPAQAPPSASPPPPPLAPSPQPPEPVSQPRVPEDLEDRKRTPLNS